MVCDPVAKFPFMLARVVFPKCKDQYKTEKHLRYAAIAFDWECLKKVDMH